MAPENIPQFCHLFFGRRVVGQPKGFPSVATSVLTALLALKPGTQKGASAMNLAAPPKEATGSGSEAIVPPSMERDNYHTVSKRAVQRKLWYQVQQNFNLGNDLHLLNHWY